MFFKQFSRLDRIRISRDDDAHPDVWQFDCESNRFGDEIDSLYVVSTVDNINLTAGTHSKKRVRRTISRRWYIVIVSLELHRVSVWKEKK